VGGAGAATVAAAGATPGDSGVDAHAAGVAEAATGGLEETGTAGPEAGGLFAAPSPPAFRHPKTLKTNFCVNASEW